MLTIKKLVLQSILLFGLLLACRKSDKLPESFKENQIVEKDFFTRFASSDPRINRVMNYVKSQNKKYNFIPKLIENAGYPFWSKTKIYPISLQSVQIESEDYDSSFVTFTPFIKEEENTISAVLILKINGNDTLHKMLYDWEYQTFNENNPTDSTWNGLDVFHIFAYLHNDIFGHSDFRILDEDLLTGRQKELLDSGNKVFDSVQVVYYFSEHSSEVSSTFEICEEIPTCIVFCEDLEGRENQTESHSQCCWAVTITEICTPVWFNWPDPGSGGGSSGSGGTPQGGGSGGNWLNPCGLLNTQRGLPCGPGWIPLDPPCPGGVVLEGECYTPLNYPGKEDGWPYEWWANEVWLDANFSLDTEDYQSFRKLTTAEKLLVIQYPGAARKIQANVGIAMQKTIDLFGINGLNDKADAFRHAFFQALNCQSVNLFKVLAFAHAHESEVPIQLAMEKAMDLFNNNIGVAIGETLYPNAPTQTALANAVMNKLNNGELVYLYPVDKVASPPWGSLPNCNYCLNGIISTTQITPTNQP